MYTKQLLRLCLIIFVIFAGVGCGILDIFRSKSKSQEPPQLSEAISSNELANLLKKDRWHFIDLPRANIHPGDIVTFRDNILETPKGGLEECFPGLRGERKGPDDAAIPYFFKIYNFQAKMIGNLIPVVNTTSEYTKVKYFTIHMNGGKTEHIMTIPLEQYIRKHYGSFDSTCRDELRKPDTQIITETLSASGILTLFDKDNRTIEITADGLAKFLRLEPSFRIIDAQGGGLEIGKTLPIAFRSEHIEVSRQGWLQLLPNEIIFDKGNLQVFQVRNIGDDGTQWWIKKYGAIGFVFNPQEESIDPSKTSKVEVHWVDCVEHNQKYDFPIAVKNSPQEPSMRISVSSDCPPMSHSAQPEKESIAVPSNPGIEKLVEGIAAYSDNNFQAALASLKQAKRLTPSIEKAPAYIKYVGLSQYMTGDSKSALRTFEKLETLSPEGFVYGALVLSTQGQVEKSKNLITNEGAKAALVSNSRLQKELSSTFGERHYYTVLKSGNLVANEKAVDFKMPVDLEPTAIEAFPKQEENAVAEVRISGILKRVNAIRGERAAWVIELDTSTPIGTQMVKEIDVDPEGKPLNSYEGKRVEIKGELTRMGNIGAGEYSVIKVKSISETEAR
jgi:tetratricopeptide (TPR) repeat protein